MRGLVSHRRKLRIRALGLAIFIFVLTATIQFTHTCTSDGAAIFPYGIGFSLSNESYASRADSKPCIACMIIDTFNTAQIALVILLLFFATLFGHYSGSMTDVHYRIFAPVWFIRGPPSPSFSL